MRGKPLVTGKEAECYANHYIGVHVTLINNGKTYSQTSNDARTLEDELAAMPDQNSAAAKKLSAQAQVLQGKATTLFQGETLRGLLLTSYGFSIFGDRAQQAADGSASRSRSCCSSPRSPASSTPPPSRPNNRSCPTRPDDRRALRAAWR